MKRGNDWSARIARDIGRQVASYREQAHMTAVMLSGRCTELGLPLDRNVIAKLENGHRNSVTVDELLIMAKALDVAPVDLLIPRERGEPVEILPGQSMHPAVAAGWFCSGASGPTVAVLRHKIADLARLIGDPGSGPVPTPPGE